MNPSDQSQPVEAKNETQDGETYAWNPEKFLKTLMSHKGKLEDKWIETDLPKLVDDIIKNYETFGGMDHLVGRDLPSKKVVIEVLEDLLNSVLSRLLGKNGHNQI